MSKLIVEAITEHYGERCPDYDEDCFCCKVWSDYDALTSPVRCDELVTAKTEYRWLAIDGWKEQPPIFEEEIEEKRELVTRQNAEEVIAAKDARISELEAENKRLREALKDLVERFSYYAALARDGVPNIEDWAYTEGSSDIAKARAALGEVKP